MFNDTFPEALYDDLPISRKISKDSKYFSYNLDPTTEQSAIHDYLMSVDPNTLRSQAEIELVKNYQQNVKVRDAVNAQMDEAKQRLAGTYADEQDRVKDKNRLKVLRAQWVLYNKIPV